MFKSLIILERRTLTGGSSLLKL
jgi:hypothetical protein